MEAITILYVAGAIALLALAVLFVYLVLLIKRANDMIDKQVTPMLDDAKAMTESLKPAVAQIDPLMERVNLTMDAANLEIMRVDEIMQDVSVITDKLADTTTKANEVTNIPLNAVNGVASKVRGVFKGRGTSDASATLAAQKEVSDQ
jgi:uncharacterized protein YoxC